MEHRRQSRFAAAALAFAMLLLAPAAARAHGAINPVATSYLARLSHIPAGLEAKVVDGDLRMWLQVQAGESVTVLDYSRVPYLRFTSQGVQVNQNSAMYYLNLTPQSLPPASLTPRTPPHWISAAGGRTYEWHDGRLQDLSGEALLPGQRFLGAWSIPLLVKGHPAKLSGGVWFKPAPSIVWFWPIAVIVLCALAAWRLRSARIDRRLARSLAAAVLGATLLAAAGRWLHGRPGIAATGVAELILAAAFVAWAGQRLARGRAGAWTLLAIVAVGLWFGFTLLPTLLHGYTLLAVPAFLARAATVVLLGASASLLLVLVRLVDPLGKRATEATAVASALTLALTLAGCGTTTSPSKANNSKASRAPLPQALIAQARPVGRGPQFHPPVTGPILGLCLPSLGPRYQVHLELFRANRVVLIGTGIGVRGPARLLDGRIIKARCYGALATLDPTGVLLIRTGTSVTLGQAFRSWGVPLHGRLYVNGRRVTGIEPATLKLTPDAEVVLEQGPYVPPHHSYRFPPVTSWR